jgi:hypothetical protein
MFLGRGFDPRLVNNLTTRGNVGQVPKILSIGSVFAENPQVKIPERHGNDMSPCSTDVCKVVPLHGRLKECSMASNR